MSTSSDAPPSTSDVPPPPSSGPDSEPCPTHHISGAPGGVDDVTIVSYDNIHRVVAGTVYHPASVAELADLLRKASLDPEAHRITFRAGGQSLDAQAINDDVVIHLDAPDLAQVGEPQRDERGWFVRIGAAAKWEQIVEKTAAYGLLPYSVVSTMRATVGGTVACDCLSRCSPVSGREGQHVRSFKVLTVDGALHECTKDDPDPDRRELFHAVIGGFGYLGVLVEVTIDLRPPVPGFVAGQPIRVVTHVDKFLVGEPAGCRWAEFLPHLLEAVSRVRTDGRGHGILDQLLHRKDDPRRTTEVHWDAVSSSAWYALGQTEVFLFQSQYVTGKELDPLPFYDKINPLLRNLPEGFDSHVLTELVQGSMFLLYPARTYVNELSDFMFFMENHLGPIRAAAKDEGWWLNSIQQTFVIPVAPTKEDPSGCGPAQAFLEHLWQNLRERPAVPVMFDPLRPCFFDVLYLPADEFLLSSNRDLPGFAITVSWTDHNADTWPQIKDRLHTLSRVCQGLGGRVHLVKHVEADPAELRAMYAGAFDRFLALKRRYDPKGLLRNEFFDRVFVPERTARQIDDENAYDVR